jgi:hypothetical protein
MTAQARFAGSCRRRSRTRRRLYAHVLQIGELVEGNTDTSPDKRRDAVPGADIDISAPEDHAGAQIGMIGVEAACGRDFLAQAGDLSESMFHGVEMSVPLAIVARGSGFEDRENFRDRSVRSRRTISSRQLLPSSSSTAWRAG